LEQASIPEARVNELLHRFLGVPGALLNAPDQFVFTALLVAKVVIGQLRVLLFELSFDDIPIAFDMECVHFDIPFLFVDCSFIFSTTTQVVSWLLSPHVAALSMG
jgi:hypothetical protein